jgi:hypothetical protein
MAVAANPSVSSIVTQALKRAGRTNPTATQITEAADHALQEVKADIMLVAPTHPSLRRTATLCTARGQQRYPLPEDWNEQDSIMLLSGPDDWLGELQDAEGTTITLDAALSVAEDDILSKYILLTDGIGQGEYREIVSYNNGTKVAEVEAPWVNIPVDGVAYTIITSHKQLWPSDTAADFDKRLYPTSIGIPTFAAINGDEFLLYPVPDKSTYGLLNRYSVDLALVDEAGLLFVKLLREWRSTWIQGVAVKSMQRFDEDRYQGELNVYKQMLDFLSSQTCRVRQMRQAD